MGKLGYKSDEGDVGFESRPIKTSIALQDAVPVGRQAFGRIYMAINFNKKLVSDFSYSK